MKRWLWTSALALVLAGCQLPPERTVLRPLPDEGAVLSYAELLTRARAQATVATEAFYINRWADLEDAAKGLDQTARFLARSEDVPPKHKPTLPQVTGDLGKEATKLLEAAKGRNERDVNATLQRVNYLIRELRLDP